MVAVLREPTVGDAGALGEIHVAAWQHAYRGGLMADDYLDGLDSRERGLMWAEALRGPATPGTIRFLGENEQGVVTGFIVAGPGGDPETETGQVHALNVAPSAWGSGHGRALLNAGTHAPAEAGFGNAILWVHPGNNRARLFYERNGWRTDGKQRRQEVLGVEVPEVLYWRRLSPA
jgi:ribosomal protein S18 acetylase RimI-like enzyme